MNAVDWIAVVLVGLTALAGVRRGLVTGVLSLAGLVVGALIGARLAPDVVGVRSAYVPLVALGVAAGAAMLGRALGGMAGGWVRSTLSIVPPLRWLDSVGGVVFGAVTGLALCWAVAAVLLYVPGQSELRRQVQESTILSSLVDAVPPDEVMDALGRVDSIAALIGPAPSVDPPDPAIVRDPQVRAARASVVRVRGVACGLGVEGSGWIAAPGVVVTNAHVVAGVESPLVDHGDGAEPARTGAVVSFDERNDVAVLRVPGLRGRALQVGDAVEGASGAVLGFPDNGPLAVTAARIGRSATVTSRDAYGRIVVGREVVTLRGAVRNGNSGGPVVGTDGRVQATVFARRRSSDDGYAVPNELTLKAITAEGEQVRTDCVERTP